MSIIRNITFMGISTAMRLGFGLLTFVVMARMLGASQFGVVMLWLSIATLLCLIANFGFTPYLLREIGARPDSLRQVMSEVLTAKLLLSALVVVIGLIALSWVEETSRPVFIALLIALLADTMTEFFNVGFRATNRFADETRLASIASCLQFCIVATAIWLLPKPEVAAAAFMVSRLLVLLMTWKSQAQFISGLGIASASHGIRRIRDAFAYATDFGLQSLFGQIDSVVLNHYVGPAAVGIYQAGMRVFNGGAQASGVLANVFLPRAARVAADSMKLATESARMQWTFVGVGFGFGLFMAAAGKPLVNILFGQDFEALITLMPWLGLLFFIRFFAASWGVVLTSAGQQKFRTLANLAQWCVTLAIAWLVVPRLGSVGWICCLLVGNLLLAVAYCARGMHISRLTLKQPLSAGLASLMFLPFLNLQIFQQLN